MGIVWRIYYGDGSTFDSSQGGPEDAPCLNIMHIVARDMRQGSDPHNIGRYIVSGKDHYWHENEEWWGGDLFGLWDYLARPGLKIVKFGRVIGNKVWREMYQKAHDDPDFPPKSAYVKGEYQRNPLRAQDEASVY